MSLATAVLLLKSVSVWTYLAENDPMTNTEPVAVVTGGSKGIGRALAAALLESGRHVLITGRAEASLRAAVDDLGVVARR